MNRKFFALTLFAIILSLLACKKNHSNTNPKNTITSTQKNIFFYKPQLRQIFNYINQADTQALYNNISAKDSLIRKNALLGLALIDDSLQIYPIIQKLNDSAPSVRQAAAFTLGVIGSPNATDFLIKQYYNEPVTTVRAQIIQALGQCSDYRGLHFLLHIPFDVLQKNPKLLSHYAKALYFFGLRGMTNINLTKKILQILKCYNCPTNAKLYASFYLVLPNININHLYGQLFNIYNQTQNQYIKANILLALAKTKNLESYNFIKLALKEHNPYIRTAAAKALAKLNAFNTRPLMTQLLKDSNISVASIAAKFFIYNGLDSEAMFYFNLGKQISAWKPRTLMFHAALKYAPDSDRMQITKSIINGFNVTENLYEKARLLEALAYDPSQFEFVRDQVFYSGNKVLSTTGIRTLVKMRYNPLFYKYAQKAMKSERENLYKEFAILFKEAMRRGDNAMIFYSANILDDKRLKMINNFENTFYINQALSNLVLPRDYRAYKAVCKLMADYGGQPCPNKKIKMSPIDWNTLIHLKPNQKIIIRTSKGNITVQLNIKQAPIASASFVKLILSEYYNNIYVCNVLPNNRIEISSRRGDWWPDKNIIHRITPSYNNFPAGTLAMALQGKGIESMQFFITLRPSPELIGKYTALGQVVKGMNILRHLTEGDKIFSIELL